MTESAIFFLVLGEELAGPDIRPQCARRFR